jgi:putative intracellular protease/amidase
MVDSRPSGAAFDDSRFCDRTKRSVSSRAGMILIARARSRQIRVSADGRLRVGLRASGFGRSMQPPDLDRQPRLAVHRLAAFSRADMESLHTLLGEREAQAWPHLPAAHVPRAIWLVVFPGFELLGAFNLGRDFHQAAYEVRVVSVAGGLVSGSSGVAIDTAPPARSITSIRSFVGAPTTAILYAQSETANLVRTVAPRARRKASVCTGAFLLASAGVLEGHRATTRWRYAGELQRRHPGLKIDADRIFVRENDVWTSAGITAGIDLALAMIEENCGIETS